MTIDIDEAKVARGGLALGFWWTAATVIGMVLGYLPAALFVQEIDLGIARIIVPLLAGVFIGVAQWLVLRGYVTSSRDWILNQAGGWVVGYILGLAVLQILARIPFGTIIGFLLFGVIVALFQWPVLRREIPHIVPWILANAFGWTLAAYLSRLIVGWLYMGKNTPLLGPTLLTVAVAGLVGGVITAAALIWIVRKPERTVYTPNRG